MIFIELVKWSLILGAMWFSFYLYSSENRKLAKLNKHIDNKELIASFRRSSQRKMFLILVMFAAFILWMMSYDFIVEEVRKENSDLTSELSEASKIYENLSESQIRLLKANDSSGFAEEISRFYTEVLKNYYVMKKCKLAGKDDVFIINTALTREMWLNNVPFSLREKIITNARNNYNNEGFLTYDCGEIHGRFNNIINNYQNYILATREVLKSTF